MSLLEVQITVKVVLVKFSISECLIKISFGYYKSRRVHGSMVFQSRIVIRLP